MGGLTHLLLQKSSNEHERIRIFEIVYFQNIFSFLPPTIFKYVVPDLRNNFFKLHII